MAGKRRNDERWLEIFESYKRYVEVHHRFPSTNLVFEGFNLGQWYRNQITAAAHGFLPEDRRQMLDDFNSAWNSLKEDRAEAERTMVLDSGWQSKVADNDIPLDAVFSGSTLDVCVLNGIYSCRQYLEYFEENHGSANKCLAENALQISHQFYDAKPCRFIVNKFGNETFCLDNRRMVFEALFPNLSFSAFNIVNPVLGLGKSFVEDARIYSLRSRFSSSKNMLDKINEVLSTLKGREQEVLFLRCFKGMTYDEIGNSYPLSSERIRQIERQAFRRLRHPSRSKEFAPYSDFELLTLGKGALVPNGSVFHGNLSLKDSACNFLPDYFMVKGFLDLENTPIKSLPKRLWVDGDLILLGTEVKELPTDLVVRGNLCLADKISELSEGVRVSGSVLKKHEESFGVVEALTGVEELGFSEKIVNVLAANGIRVKMDLLDLDKEDLSRLVGLDENDIKIITTRMNDHQVASKSTLGRVDDLIIHAFARIEGTNDNFVPQNDVQYDVDI